MLSMTLICDLHVKVDLCDLQSHRLRKTSWYDVGQAIDLLIGYRHRGLWLLAIGSESASVQYGSIDANDLP